MKKTTVDQIATKIPVVDLVPLCRRTQYPIHRADRTQIGAFIQQGGKDLSGRLIRKAGFAQMVQHLVPFPFRQGPRRRWSCLAQRWRGRQCRAVSKNACTGQGQRGANGGGKTAAGGQSNRGGHHDLPPRSCVCSISSRSAATFFWIAMIASA